MRRFVICFLLTCMLCTSTAAAEIPDNLTDAAPEQKLLEGMDFGGAGALNEGIGRMGQAVQDQLGTILRSRVRNLVLLLMVVLLCGLTDGFFQGTASSRIRNFVPMAGALSITLLSAGSIDSLIGLGAGTIEELNQFSKALLPTLAAATAACGSVGTATVHQVATVFFVDLLLNLINGILIPMTYLYIGALTAGVMLPDYPLGGIAEMLKKVITWILSGALLIFTAYLGVGHIISGAADALSVRVARTAISGMVPVVGGIISEASETVLAGAGMLKNTIGIFGMLVVMATCLAPFLQLGVQYLLYKLAAFASGAVGIAPLVKLLNGLGGAFGLVLGMTGSCALLLLISLLSSVAAVIP
ncbi:stage III sporulation protein AE [Oscillibacter sp. MSJ-2]|uniref:Stage III sporulation protein AE n=2 Tax=Dysosmobacter acutus TaxID=2841504 RepID=A0ABS6FA61_9FIRM|nr:stage III sporulation protein AE [Dysosmobacter acutus]